MHGDGTRWPLVEMVLAAVFAAVVAALAALPPIRLPLSPVPITLQTLGVMLAGSLLGPRTGAMALVIYVLLAAAGAPVLAGGQGGASHLLGPSGGFILSWPLAAYVIGALTDQRSSGFGRFLAANVIGGILIVYAIGVPVLAIVTGMGWQQALIAGALVFIPGDLLKAVVASTLAMRVRHRLRRAHPGHRASSPAHRAGS